MPHIIAATDTWLTELADVRAYPIVDIDERDEVRRMQAAAYSRSSPYSVGRNGMVDDIWVDVATYFVVRGPNDRVLATCRLIPSTSLSLPTLESDRVSPEWRQHFQRRRPSEVGEVASLAVDPGPFSGASVSAALYRTLFQFTMARTDQLTWIATMDRVLHQFTTRFLRVPSDVLGEVEIVRGRKTHAYAIQALEYLRKAREDESVFWDYLCRGLVIDLTGSGNLVLDSGESHLRA